MIPHHSGRGRGAGEGARAGQEWRIEDMAGINYDFIIYLFLITNELGWAESVVLTVHVGRMPLK